MVVYGGANATRQRSAPVGSDPTFASSLRPENTSHNGTAIAMIAMCCIQMIVSVRSQTNSLFSFSDLCVKV